MYSVPSLNISLTLIISLLAASLVFPQKNGDYIVKSNGDTLSTRVIKIDKNSKGVLCQENEKKRKYEAKELLAVKCDTAFYEVGLVKLKSLKSKRYVLLRRTVKGKLNLYEIEIKKTKFLAKAFGDDFIHLRWVFRAQPWFKGVTSTIPFYKKENDPKRSYSKSWKEKTKDCKAFQDKIKSKSVLWSPNPKELVEFYNKNCL